MRTCLLLAASLLCGCAGATDVNSGRKTYTGPYSATFVESTVSTSLQGGGTFPCTNTYTMTGILTMTIGPNDRSTVGTAQIDGVQTETAHSSGDSCKAKGNLSTVWSPTLTGTTTDLHFAEQNVATNGTYVVTSKATFAGTLSGGVVTGVLGFSVLGTGTIGTTSGVQSYSTTMNVVLQ